MKPRTRFDRDEAGVALVETLLVLPVLTGIFLAIIYFSVTTHTMTLLERSARVAAKDLSVGRADDETNGVLTACSLISGVDAAGNASAEKIACDIVASAPGQHFVSASDGAAGGPGSEGDAATVQISVARSAMFTVSFLPKAGESAFLSARTVLRMQVVE